MPIRTTVRYQFLLTKMAITVKTVQSISKDVEGLEASHTSIREVTVALENSMVVL